MFMGLTYTWKLFVLLWTINLKYTELKDLLFVLLLKCQVDKGYLHI